MLGLFDPHRPLHLLKGSEHGHDIRMVNNWLEKSTGSKARFITPQDLRLIPDTGSHTGYALHCVVEGKENGETEKTEPIVQVGLELHQTELRDLPTPILQHLALCCFNDLRTIFLVHDKRMLGIVLQELKNLLNRKVITHRQAILLREHIARTIIPGSDELRTFIEACERTPSHKDNYILKLIRSGKGKGMIFGSDLTHAEWMEKILDLQDAQLVPAKPTYVVQRLVHQQTYELLLRDEEGLQRNALVGTYMAFQGRFVGSAVWRSSPDRVCAISSGGAWLCSVKASDADATTRVEHGLTAKKQLSLWFGYSWSRACLSFFLDLAMRFRPFRFKR